MKWVVITPSDNDSSREVGRWGATLASHHTAEAMLLKPRNRSEVEAALRAQEHVLYFGHGERNALVIPGRLFRRRVVLIDALNVRSTDRIVVAVACWAADGLGPDVTDPRNGPPIRAFVGWRDDVSIPFGYPDPIRDAILAALELLFAGQTVRDVVEEMTRHLDTAHDTYRNNGRSMGLSAEAVQFAKAEALYWKQRVAVLGDQLASIVSASTPLEIP